MVREDRAARQEAEELPSAESLYLREIGELPLLTSAQEVELGRQMEEGDFLLRLQREAVHEHDLTYQGLARQLLRRLRQHVQLLGRSGVFPASPRASALLADEIFQRATERAIDEGLVSKIASGTGETENAARTAVLELAIISRIVMPSEADVEPTNEDALSALAGRLPDVERQAAAAKSRRIRA